MPDDLISVMSPADFLEGRRSEILQAYRRRLRDVGSALERDPDACQELERQASQVVTVCVATLRRSGAVPNDIASDPSELIRAGRALRHLHPIEALRASSLLFETVMDELTVGLRDHQGSIDLLDAAARALNHGVQQWAEAMATGYDAFLYRRFKDGHSAERRRLAREIHDHVSNSMSAGIRNLELYEIHRDGDPEAAHSRFEQARSMLVESMSNMHNMISELRMTNPMDSVATGMQTFLDSVQESGTVDMRVTGNECWLSTEYRDQIFIIIREALRNAFTYSQAEKVAVRLDITPHQVRAVIEDEGVGFDVERVLGTGRAHGLTSMRERVELLGGRLRLASRPQFGTLIDLLIPLPDCQCDRER